MSNKVLASPLFGALLKSPSKGLIHYLGFTENVNKGT